MANLIVQGAKKVAQKGVSVAKKAAKKAVTKVASEADEMAKIEAQIAKAGSETAEAVVKKAPKAGAGAASVVDDAAKATKDVKNVLKVYEPIMSKADDTFKTKMKNGSTFVGEPFLSKNSKSVIRKVKMQNGDIVAYKLNPEKEIWDVREFSIQGKDGKWSPWRTKGTSKGAPTPTALTTTPKEPPKNMDKSEIKNWLKRNKVPLAAGGAGLVAGAALASGD